MCFFDPTADAIDILAGKTAQERHGVASLLDPDSAPQLLTWIASHPDCPLATAAMIYWRMLCLPQRDYFRPEPPVEWRLQTIEAVLTHASDGGYQANDLAWDGAELTSGVEMLGASPLPELSDHVAAHPAPARFKGPFGVQRPVVIAWSELESDWFDVLWRTPPRIAVSLTARLGESQAAA